jgi:ATP-dependent RNA helicase DeaD
MDGLEKGNLLGLICDYGDIDKGKIGKIDLKGAYSFFEVEKGLAEQVMKGFEGVEVRGRKVRLEMTGARREKFEGRGSGDGERKRKFSGGSGGRREGSWGGKKKEGSWGGGSNKGRKRY